jgi:hypothetical protein
LRRAKLHLGKGPFLGIEDIEKAISMDEKYKGYLMRASYEDALFYFDAYLTDGKVRKMIKSAKNHILVCLRRLEQINKI